MYYDWNTVKAPQLTTSVSWPIFPVINLTKSTVPLLIKDAMLITSLSGPFWLVSWVVNFMRFYCTHVFFSLRMTWWCARPSTHPINLPSTSWRKTVTMATPWSAARHRPLILWALILALPSLTRTSRRNTSSRNRGRRPSCRRMMTATANSSSGLQYVALNLSW